MSDSSSLSSLLAEQLMLINPEPSNDFIQGLIRGCGLKTVLDSVVAIADNDITIANQYTNAKILQNIPADYFASNNNVIDVLLSSAKPGLGPSGEYVAANNSNRFSNLLVLWTETSGNFVFSSANNTADAQDLKNVAGWVGKQKVTIDSDTKSAHLRQIICSSLNIAQPAAPTLAQALAASPAIDAFNSIGKDVTFARMRAAGFKWQEMLANNQYVSSLRVSFNLSLTGSGSVLEFVSSQTNLVTSQLPKLVSNSELTNLSGNSSKSNQYVALKVAKLLGFTSAQVLAESSSILNAEVSVRAMDIDTVFDKVIAGKPLIERLAVFKTNNGISPSADLLTNKDTANAIYNVLLDNNGENKLFNAIGSLSAATSTSYSVPSAENLRKGGVVSYIINTLCSGGSALADNVFGKPVFEIDNFFSGNADFKNLAAAMFYYNSTSNQILPRGITQTFTGTSIFNAENKKNVIFAVLNNDASKYLKVILADTNNTNNETAAIATIVSLLEDSNYSPSDILGLESGSWSNNKTPSFLVAKKVVETESYNFAKKLADYASVDLAAVRTALNDLASASSVNKILSVLSLRNYSPATLKLMIGPTDTQANLQGSLSRVAELLVNDNKPDNINIYKQLLQQYGLDALMSNNNFKAGGIKKIPAKSANANNNNVLGSWFFAFTSLADVQYLANSTESSVEDLLTYTIESSSVNVATGDVSSGTTKKLLYSPANLKSAFNLTDAEFADALAAVDYVPV